MPCYSNGQVVIEVPASEPKGLDRTCGQAIRAFLVAFWNIFVEVCCPSVKCLAIFCFIIFFLSLFALLAEMRATLHFNHSTFAPENVTVPVNVTDIPTTETPALWTD